jgi:hypothetical protein
MEEGLVQENRVAHQEAQVNMGVIMAQLLIMQGNIFRMIVMMMNDENKYEELLIITFTAFIY